MAMAQVDGTYMWQCIAQWAFVRMVICCLCKEASQAETKRCFAQDRSHQTSCICSCMTDAALQGFSRDCGISLHDAHAKPRRAS